MKKSVFLPALAAVCMLAGCKTTSTHIPHLPGHWGLIMDQPGWGRTLILNPDSTAQATNFPNTLLQSWQLKGDSLIIAGKYVQHGFPIAFTDTMRIDPSSTDDTLVLTKGDLTQRFRLLKRL